MDEAALQMYDNMIKLNALNEPVILHNLRQRFMKDLIYTYVSSILVACNPFKLLPIYTPEIMDKYKDGGGRHQPPHIFAIADNAYRNLMADFKDQAVVISGESGAGKTETMKLVLQFLADVSGRAQKMAAAGDKQESLEQQILKSNPVMEAFGNAKTTRNNNSSRFGKWTEIKFNRTGAIVGGSIINYLLEKSRIPFQASQERNYHIFYQLLAGGEVSFRAADRRCARCYLPVNVIVVARVPTPTNSASLLTPPRPRRSVGRPRDEEGAEAARRGRLPLHEPVGRDDGRHDQRREGLDRDERCHGCAQRVP